MKLPWITKRELVEENRQIEAELQSEKESRREIQRDLQQTLAKLNQREAVIEQLKYQEVAIGNVQRILMTTPYELP